MDNRFWKVVLALIFPPLGVIDRGCGTALLVGLLTIPLWIPGFLVALFIIFSDKPRLQRRFVEIGPAWAEDNEDEDDDEKRKGAYVRLSDGAVAEVVEDDNAPLDNFRRKNKTE